MRKIPIVVDVDTGIDDALTLMYACADPELAILAVTATYGNSTLENTLRNTLNVLKLCNREDIPVAGGATQPLVRPAIGAEHVHGGNGMGNVQLPFPDAKKALRPVPAWELLYESIMNAEDKVMMVALGPLTTAANLLTLHPDVKEKLQGIVFMGGYIRNGSMTPFSSVNVLYDPEAANIAMTSGVPFYMVPGDLTDIAFITKEEMTAFATMRSPQGKVAKELLDAYLRTCTMLGETEEGLCLHDPVTMAFLTNPELFAYGRYHAQVETESEMGVALTIIDYEDILQKPLEEKHLYYVDMLDRPAFIRNFIAAFQRYERKGE